MRSAKHTLPMTTSIPVGEDLVGLLESLNRPLEDAVRELIVLEFYRQRKISSGKAAELLGMSRIGFIEYSSRLGVPFFDVTPEELQAEVALLRHHRSAEKP
jgi:predicted HTH domain antitoxin